MELPKIKVADFEGPFDLLLHLIKKNKMDIYNVEIYKVTNQYLEYLNTRKVMDLEITSEFIVVAATLIEIKSKNLLPKIKLHQENERLKDKLKDIEKILDADCCVENVYQAMCQYLNIYDFELDLEDYLKGGDLKWQTKKSRIRFLN